MLRPATSPPFSSPRRRGPATCVRGESASGDMTLALGVATRTFAVPSSSLTMDGAPSLAQDASARLRVAGIRSRRARVFSTSTAAALIRDGGPSLAQVSSAVSTAGTPSLAQDSSSGCVSSASWAKVSNVCEGSSCALPH